MTSSTRTWTRSKSLDQGTRRISTSIHSHMGNRVGKVDGDLHGMFSGMRVVVGKGGSSRWNGNNQHKNGALVWRADRQTETGDFNVLDVQFCWSKDSWTFVGGVANQCCIQLLKTALWLLLTGHSFCLGSLSQRELVFYPLKTPMYMYLSTVVTDLYRAIPT